MKTREDVALPELRLQIDQAITEWIEREVMPPHITRGLYGQITTESLRGTPIRIEWTLRLDGILAETK